MYIFITVDPDSIDNIRTPLFRQGAETLFRLITKQNGILAVDKDNNIIKKLKRSIPTLSPSCNNIKIMLEEILKDNKKLVKISVDNTDTLTGQICQIFRKLPRASVIIIHENSIEDYRDEYIDEEPLEYFNTINDYKCQFMNRARKFRDKGVQLDFKTSDQFFYDVISRSSIFTKKISFYDYLIGNDKIPEKQLNNWTLGLKHIINYWIYCSYYIKDKKLVTNDKIKIGLITKATKPKQNKETGEWDDFNKADKHFDTLVRVILLPLKKEFGKYCEFELIMKNDRYNDFKGRFMKTDQGFMEWRKGFDLFKTSRDGNNVFTRNHVHWISQADRFNDISMIDQLEDYKHQNIQ